MNIVSAGFCATLKALKIATANAIEMAEQYEKLSQICEDQEETMNKCKWTDGKFEPCVAAAKISCIGFNINADETKPLTTYMGEDVSFCPFCGADIRKPEPAILIRKSGGTWVARYDGRDWLWMKQGKQIKPEFKEKTFDWVPIDLIEITDEIAKLRPMVITDTGGVAKLSYCDDRFMYIQWKDYDFGRRKVVRLATVDDLEATT